MPTEAQRAAKREYDQKYKPRKRLLEARERYQLSESEFAYVAMRRADGICEICGKRGKLNIDHSHATGKFRGLLCHRCNNGLGCFSDDIDLMLKAISYLKEHDIA